MTTGFNCKMLYFNENHDFYSILIFKECLTVCKKRLKIVFLSLAKENHLKIICIAFEDSTHSTKVIKNLSEAFIFFCIFSYATT